MVILDFLFNYTVIKINIYKKDNDINFEGKSIFLVKLSFLIHVFFFPKTYHFYLLYVLLNKK